MQSKKIHEDNKNNKGLFEKGRGLHGTEIIETVEDDGQDQGKLQEEPAGTFMAHMLGAFCLPEIIAGKDGINGMSRDRRHGADEAGGQSSGKDIQDVFGQSKSKTDADRVDYGIKPVIEIPVIPHELFEKEVFYALFRQGDDEEAVQKVIKGTALGEKKL